MGDAFLFIILLLSGFLLGLIFAYIRLRSMLASHHDNLMDLQQVAELEQMKSRLQEVQAQYNELEKHCNSLAHDLKSPLVTITGFSDLLEKDVAEGNMEQVSHYIEQINTGVDTLKSVMDHLQKVPTESAEPARN